MLSRRSLGLAIIASRWPELARAGAVAAKPGFDFPADFGAHPRSHIEWWYATGALEAAGRLWGFQITFFRAATGLSGAENSRFRAAQLLFAHAAVTDLANSRLRHDQRIARTGFGIATASTEDTALVLRDWRLERESGAGKSRYRTSAASESAGFRFVLELEATQSVLWQGEAGVSRKGPDPKQSSRYYSEPQLSVRGTLALDRDASLPVAGGAWLDHEWSDSLLDPSAVGWDWLGMNLDDGAALMAFRIRRGDGSTVWAGGSHRPRGGETRNFDAEDVAFRPVRFWQSPASKAAYPVEWAIATPAGRFTVKALLDDQELDSRASTGSIYWEGLAELFDAGGRKLGRGYLEMTGYAAKLVL